MLGLDAAGKTTILYKLHIGEVLSTVPTIGTAMLAYVLVAACSLQASILHLSASTQSHKHLAWLLTLYDAAAPSQVSMWRRSSTRMFCLLCGMWAVKRGFGLCGGTTSITQMV